MAFDSLPTSWQCRVRTIQFRCSYYSMCFPSGSDIKEYTCNAGDPGLIPGLGRSPGVGNGNPLQYSCLENSMNRGAWGAPVHGIPKKSNMTDRVTHAYILFCRFFSLKKTYWLPLKTPFNCYAMSFIVLINSMLGIVIIYLLMATFGSKVRMGKTKTYRLCFGALLFMK